MKNIKTLSAIVLTAITAANVFTTTASAASSKNYATSQKTADAIVNEWLDDAVEAVRDGDKKELFDLYDGSWTGEQLDLSWNGFRKIFSGEDNYETEGTVLSFTSNEITFNAIYYCNNINNRKNPICTIAIITLFSRIIMENGK